MHSALSNVLGPLLLLCGVLAALLFRFLPPQNRYYWLIPCGLLISGILFSALSRMRRWILSGFAASGLIILAMSFPIWPPACNGATTPNSGISKNLKTVQLQVPRQFRHGHLATVHNLQVPDGMKIAVFARGLRKPRMLAFSPTGDLYVSLPDSGQVSILPDRDRDGIADSIQVFAFGLDRPHGLAFDGNDLIVAENGRLSRLPDRNGDLKSDRTEVISRDLPAGGGHWTRSVVIGVDGNYYVSAGSSCNVCEEKDQRRATVMRIAKEGGPAQIYARGLRNSVGLAIHPKTGELWASNNGRDMLGDDLPPEEINRIVAGGDYGWPYCYGRKIPDPDFGNSERCRDTLPPMVEMQAHSAPLGITFGRGLNLPERLQNMLYVAFHGSWNRSTPTGYKLIGIPFEKGKPSGPPEDIVSGWLQGGSAWGRPVAPTVGPDGALYLSDDRAGVIYRITAANGEN